MIWNNRGYGSIHGQQAAFFRSDRELGTRFRKVDTGELHSADMVALGRSMGADAERVGRPGDVADRVETAPASGRPTVIEVRIDGGPQPSTGSWELPPQLPLIPGFGWSHDVTRASSERESGSSSGRRSRERGLPRPVERNLRMSGKLDERYDVVVVGAGNAGLCAALAALDRGVRVLVLERSSEEERGRFNAFRLRGHRRSPRARSGPPRVRAGADRLRLIPRVAVPRGHGAGDQVPRRFRPRRDLGPEELRHVALDARQGGTVLSELSPSGITDNGPPFKGTGFARWVRSKGHITHIRTRRKPPWNNGRIERFSGSIKYEKLYRHDIGDGIDLARHCDASRNIYNSIRPHEEIGIRRPLRALPTHPDHPTTNPRICLRFLTRDMSSATPTAPGGGTFPRRLTPDGMWFPAPSAPPPPGRGGAGGSGRRTAGSAPC